MWTVHWYTKGPCTSGICWVLWTYLSDSIIYVYSKKYIHQYRWQKQTNNNNKKYTTTLEEEDKEGESGGRGGEIGVLVGVLLS